MKLPRVGVWELKFSCFSLNLLIIAEGKKLIYQDTRLALELELELELKMDVEFIQIEGQQGGWQLLFQVS